MIVRSWNLFHGNTVPPQRRAFLDDMLRLATADDPDVLCAQEVPAWALGRFTAGDVAKRPPLGAVAGRALTALDHGRLRSAVAGQGIGILLSPRLRLLERRALVLNPRWFRASESQRLGLGARERRAWARERRVVQAVRAALPDGRAAVVANLHCTGWEDRRPADAELMRAASFVVSAAEPEDVVVLAGDFNAEPERSRALHELAGPEWGFSAPAPGIDQVLVRGADAGPLIRWPDERRLHDGRLLSDHAPVEVEIR